MAFPMKEFPGRDDDDDDEEGGIPRSPAMINILPKVRWLFSEQEKTSWLSSANTHLGKSVFSIDSVPSIPVLESNHLIEASGRATVTTPLTSTDPPTPPAAQPPIAELNQVELIRDQQNSRLPTSSGTAAASTTNESGTTCPVCLQPLNADTPGGHFAAFCGHQYCGSCLIDLSGQQNVTCSICRKPLDYATCLFSN